MSTRAVLVAAVITGLLLGIVGTRADGAPRRHGTATVTEAGR